MYATLAEAVDNADTRGQFISSYELERIDDLPGDAPKRVKMVNRITSNATIIVANAARSLFIEQPSLIAPGGNAYTSRRMSACLRDMEIILRYITYAMLTGNPRILEDRCLNGLREVYCILGTPVSSVALAISKMKDLTLSLFENQQNSQEFLNLRNELESYFNIALESVG